MQEKNLSPILLHEGGSLRTQLSRQVSRHSAWSLGPCPSQCLQWVKHLHGTCISPHTDFWPQRVLRYSCCLVFPGTNTLQPGKLRKNQLFMGECGWKQTRASWPQVIVPLLQGCPWHLWDTEVPLPTTADIPAPLSTQHPPYKGHQSPQSPPLLSQTSPACSCFAPTSACTFGFWDFSSVWRLPEAAPTQPVAVSTAPVTQICLPAIGNRRRIAGTKSASGQLCAARRGRDAIITAVLLFFLSLLCLFYEKHPPVPLLFPVNFAERGCLLQNILQEREEEQEDVTQLCWQ